MNLTFVLIYTERYALDSGTGKIRIAGSSGILYQLKYELKLNIHTMQRIEA